MIETAVLVGLVVLILALNFLPSRSVTLIEGVFSHKDRSVDFYDNWYNVYHFDYACRDCWENNRTPQLGESCAAAVPERALKLNDIEPQKGDSVKIVGYKNILGWIRAYKIDRTNFAEETAEKQFAKEKEERDEHHLALERRWALERGLSIEEYRRVTEEEDIEDAVKTLGISAEEVLANNYQKMPKGILAVGRKLTAKLGRLPTHEEMWEEDRQWMERAMASIEDGTVQNKHPEICFDSIGLLTSGTYLEFAVFGKFLDEENTETLQIKHHLEQCSICRENLDKARADFLRPREENCITDEELAIIKQTGKPTKTTKQHADYHGDFCRRCELHINWAVKQHLDSPDSQECLTKDDRHYIHTEGKVPENKTVHVEKCLRCEQRAEHHKQIYFDRVAPRSRFPTRRLESLREKQTVAAS